MTTSQIIENATQTANNIKEIESRFFPVIKVPLVPSTRTVAKAVAVNEAKILVAEIMKENAKETEKLDETNVFKLAFKKAFKKAKEVFVSIVKTENETTINLTEFIVPVDMYGIYDAKTGSLLSKKSMGADFLPMQQNEFLANILSTIHEFGADLDLSTLEFKVFGNGSKIEFSVKMFPLSFTNDKELNDITNIFLCFSTSYDGSKSNRISLFTERLVCLNKMTVAKLEGVLKGRNTQGGKTKILSYAKEVADIINGGEKFKEKMIALDAVKLSTKQVETFKKSLLGYNHETLKQDLKDALALKQGEPNQKSKFKILESLDKAIALEFSRTGQTAFGLLQGVTYYTNHLSNTSKGISNEEYIRFFTGAKINDKAQEILFALVD